MTEFEHLILSVCFSAVIGYTAGSLIGTIVVTIMNYREKKRLKKYNDQ